MKIEVFNAFVKAGVPESDAKAAVESIHRMIDRRCNDHRYAQQPEVLATKSDLAEAKVKIIQSTIGSMLAAVGLFATITKLWH